MIVPVSFQICKINLTPQKFESTPFLSATPEMRLKRRDWGNGEGVISHLALGCKRLGHPLSDSHGFPQGRRFKGGVSSLRSSTADRGGRKSAFPQGRTGERGERVASTRAGLPCRSAQHRPSTVLQRRAVPSSLPVSRRCPSGLRLSQLMPPRWSAQTLSADPLPPISGPG